MIKKNSILFLGLFLTILFVLLSFCSNNDLESDGDPVLSSITPSSKAVNMPQFILTATGSGFHENAKIFFNNSEMVTTFISETELKCAIPANSLDLTDLQNKDSSMKLSLREIPVQVKNGGGNNSGTTNFSIKDNNSFILPVKLTEGNTTSFNPSITIDPDGNIFIIYERYELADDNCFVSIIRSEDGGKVWSDPVDIFESDERIYNPAITSGPDGVIYTTFYNANLYFSFSDDSGETWSDPNEISFSTPTPIESKILTDSDGNINIVWLLPSYSQNTSIYYMRSEDGGVTFSTAINISVEKDNFNIVYGLSLAVDGSGVYTGWTAWPLGGSRYSHVYFNYSNDNGSTWNSEDKYFGVCSASDISADGGSNVYFVLSSSYLPFQNRIGLFMSTDSGVS
ncbi:MAG: exo-alpha-sialidase, partial [Candidatus Aminicenantes bacterium]|nr:exo-alpha-sialidase [Candidatus Aminicenantes bacterium]